MNWSAPTLSALLLTSAFTFGEDQAPNWIKVTDKAGWQPRDSSGEVVFKDRLWIPNSEPLRLDLLAQDYNLKVAGH